MIAALLPALLQDAPEASPVGEFAAFFERPVVRATTIVLASFVVARLVDWVVTAILKALAKRSKTRFDDKIIDSLHGPIVKTVVLVGLWHACGELESDDEPTLWLHRLIVTLGLLVWIAAALRTSSIVMNAAAKPDSRFRVIDGRTLPLFDNLAKVILVGLAGYVVIEIWELDATGWLATAGVAGIALGFAAQDTLANLFAGVFIIADAPYRIGDYIVLDSGHRGRVLQIGLRSTRILTRDDVQIAIPNSIIGNSSIVNETSGTPQYRLRVQVGVAYGSDVDHVVEVLLGVADASDGLLRHPEPRVRFRRFGESSLDFELLLWIREPEERGRTLHALNMAVYKAFAEAGIEIAFPQRDLHVRSMPSDWVPAAGAADPA